MKSVHELLQLFIQWRERTCRSNSPPPVQSSETLDDLHFHFDPTIFGPMEEGDQVSNESAPLDFSYVGTTAADKWGSLNPKYAECSAGKRQSPVDILKDQAVPNKTLGPLSADYRPQQKATLSNHGYHIGVAFGENAGVLKIGDKSFTLKQMHWHSPSEHKINGEKFAAELHLVHGSAEGGTAVVGILFRVGGEDPLLAKMKMKLEELAKERYGSNKEIPIEELNTNDIVKNTNKYYRYIGSLTSPPCTENVIWTLFDHVRPITKEQVAALKAPLDAAFKDNIRPVQPLNGRKIELFE